MDELNEPFFEIPRRFGNLDMVSLVSVLSLLLSTVYLTFFAFAVSPRPIPELTEQSIKVLLNFIKYN